MTFFVVISGEGLMLVLGATDLNVQIQHGGNGIIEFCMKPENHEDNCEEFNLNLQPSPFTYTGVIEDPDKGDEVEICFEIKNSQNDEECKEFEFTGEDPQTVQISIPSTVAAATPNSGNAVTDFSLGSGAGDTPPPPAQQTQELQPLPPLPPPLPAPK